MKLSYAITVCNEFVEIQKLISFLLENKKQQDEIVILYDIINGDKRVEEYLRSHSVNGEFNWHPGEFKGHFANWKNKLTSLCNGDFIFQIDADEYPNKELLETLPFLLEMNKDVDVMLLYLWKKDLPFTTQKILNVKKNKTIIIIPYEK